MLVVIMGMLIFSGLAYVGEKDEKDTMFISMPQVLHQIRITCIPSVINVPGSVLGHYHHDLGWLWRHCPNYLVWKTGGIRQEQKLFHLNQDVISLFQRVPSAACSASRSPSPSLSTTSISSTRRPRSRRRYSQRRREHLGKRLKEVTL